LVISARACSSVTPSASFAITEKLRMPRPSIRGVLV
jgi:hypothetical protein